MLRLVRFLWFLLLSVGGPVLAQDPAMLNNFSEGQSWVVDSTLVLDGEVNVAASGVEISGTSVESSKQVVHYKILPSKFDDEQRTKVEVLDHYTLTYGQLDGQPVHEVNTSALVGKTLEYSTVAGETEVDLKEKGLSVDQMVHLEKEAQSKVRSSPLPIFWKDDQSLALGNSWTLDLAGKEVGSHRFESGEAKVAVKRYYQQLIEDKQVLIVELAVSIEGEIDTQSEGTLKLDLEGTSLIVADYGMNYRTVLKGKYELLVNEQNEGFLVEFKGGGSATFIDLCKPTQ